MKQGLKDHQSIQEGKYLLQRHFNYTTVGCWLFFQHVYRNHNSLCLLKNLVVMKNKNKNNLIFMHEKQKQPHFDTWKKNNLIFMHEKQKQPHFHELKTKTTSFSCMKNKNNLILIHEKQKQPHFHAWKTKTTSFSCIKNKNNLIFMH